MATLGNTFLGLADLYKQKEGDGSITAQVIEMMAQTNEILTDAMVIECNNGTKHRTTMRTGIPSPTWRRFYEGVQPTKSSMKQIEDATGMAEDRSEIDEDLVKISGDPAQFRLNESMAHIEGMSQEMASKMIYGNTDSDPEQFLGLAPRFDSLSAESAQMIVNAAGSGSDNTSVWFVIWGDRATHLIYPKGTKAGIEHQDLGVLDSFDANKNRFRAYHDLYKWHIGLTVRDWRKVSRIANIDVSDLRAGTVDIYKFMRNAYWKLSRSGALKSGKAVIYCNADVLEALDAKATAGNSGTATVYLQRDQVEGKEVISYRGIPIRQVDAILNTESPVT